MKKDNHFDRVSGVYDSLAKLIFNESLLEAERSLIHFIPINSKILIIGGGTGRTLTLLNEIKPQKVTFLDKSPKMIERARKSEILCQFKVEYICQDFLDINLSTHYHALITPFFLDCFNGDELKLIVDKCRSLIKREGYWLLTDFQNTQNAFNRFLVGVMYLFFRVTSNLKSSHLENYRELLLDIGGRELYYRTSSRNLLFSTLFQFNS